MNYGPGPNTAVERTHAGGQAFVKLVKLRRRRAPLTSTLAIIRLNHRSLDATLSAMIDWSTCPAVERDPERVSGAWVFRGTRIPVAALFENLEDGAQLAEFVEWFPGVTLAQARQVLEHAVHSLETA